MHCILFAGIPFSIGVDGLISFIETLRDQHLRPSDIDCIAAIGGKMVNPGVNHITDGGPWI